MTKTTMKNADGTVEIAVVIMSTYTTALLVNVWNNNLNLYHWLGYMIDSDHLSINQTFIIIGAELGGAAGACAPPLFTPRPEIYSIKCA